MQESGPGPQQNPGAAQWHFRCPGNSGPTADMAGMVEIDPSRHVALQWLMLHFAFFEDLIKLQKE
jgi:hypothetical protein